MCPTVSEVYRVYSILSMRRLLCLAARTSHLTRAVCSRDAVPSLAPRRLLATKGASDNLSAIQEEFTRQAGVFENQWDLRMKKDNREIMSWVLEKMGDIPSSTRALDVATGTGIFARALSPLCR